MKRKKNILSLMEIFILLVIITFLGCNGDDKIDDNINANPPINSSLQILIPLYSYPNWYDPNKYIWDDVAKASSKVPITAIINPNNGPDGCPPNSDYQRGISDLRNFPINILGYVYTEYGTRDPNNIKNDIDIYYECYEIDGVFFDQVDTNTNKFNYYQKLYNHVKSRPNQNKVILNPGTNIDEIFLSISDVIIIFEDYSENWASYQPDAYVTDYQAERFSVLIHTVPNINIMKAHINLVKDYNIGYVYITDDTLNNPWDTHPIYWQAEIDYIAIAK